MADGFGQWRYVRRIRRGPRQGQAPRASDNCQVEISSASLCCGVALAAIDPEIGGLHHEDGIRRGFLDFRLTTHPDGNALLEIARHLGPAPRENASDVVALQRGQVLSSHTWKDIDQRHLLPTGGELSELRPL